MMCSSPPPVATELSALHSDIVECHVLPQLDGASLASMASCSATLRRLSSPEKMWSDICHSTWPSTNSPLVISAFPDGGPRTFFAQAFQLPEPSNHSSSSGDLPSKLISAVDIHYKDKLVFTKVHTTDTYARRFPGSPFRIDLLELESADLVPTPIKDNQDGEHTCSEMIREMTLTWILIDPSERRVVNLSSHKAVMAYPHGLSGEVRVQFASILSGHTLCQTTVTCSLEDVGIQVREVSLEMEDIDGTHLRGSDSLIILHGALEGKKGSGRNRVVEARRRYEEFWDKKRERRERELRIKGALDVACLTFVVSFFVVFLVFCYELNAKITT